MKNALIAAAIFLVSTAASVSANPFSPIENDPNILINNLVIEDADEFACYGCISPKTGRIRDGYVRPHVRSNGRYVSGYYRS